MNYVVISSFSSYSVGGTGNVNSNCFEQKDSSLVTKIENIDSDDYDHSKANAVCKRKEVVSENQINA